MSSAARVAWVGLLVGACADEDEVIPSVVDPAPAVRSLVEAAGVVPLEPMNRLPWDDARVQLGRALFFDKELSGNRDISCATCHHPLLGTSDGLPTSIGTGGSGLGPSRDLGEGFLIPRNAPDLFNRGDVAWRTMFWDSRVEDGEGVFHTPAAADLPSGLDTLLAAQALFPVTSAHEMAGEPGTNELADAEDLPTLWARLVDRVKALPGYRVLLDAAYPTRGARDADVVDLANALAAFQTAAFTSDDAPFQRFVKGDDDALSAAELRGAALFFGGAGCASCHRGPLLSDQDAHCLGVPQVGPGKGDEAPDDHGRASETGDALDRWAFRTPSLWNVGVTAPYFHSGAYMDLEDAIRQHLAPWTMLSTFEEGLLPRPWREEVHRSEGLETLVATTMRDATVELSDAQVRDLLLFLDTLTDPGATRLGWVIPRDVPSGLAVQD